MRSAEPTGVDLPGRDQATFEALPLSKRVDLERRTRSNAPRSAWANPRSIVEPLVGPGFLIVSMMSTVDKALWHADCNESVPTSCPVSRAARVLAAVWRSSSTRSRGRLGFARSISRAGSAPAPPPAPGPRGCAGTGAAGQAGHHPLGDQPRPQFGPGFDRVQVVGLHQLRVAEDGALPVGRLRARPRGGEFGHGAVLAAVVDAAAGGGRGSSARPCTCPPPSPPPCSGFRPGSADSWGCRWSPRRRRSPAGRGRSFLRTVRRSGSCCSRRPR